MFSVSMLPPLLGQFTAFFLFYSPCPGLVRDRRQGRLTTDPTPFPFAFTSTLVWCIYGARLEDLPVFMCNIIGLAATTFNTTTVLRLCRDEGVAVRLEIVTISGVLMAAAAVLTTMTSVLIEDEKVKTQILGYLAIAVCVVMFASPVAETVKAVRSGDTSKISMPLAAAQLINGILWMVYGMSQGNVVISGPNAAGAALALASVLVKVLVKQNGLDAGAQYSVRDAVKNQSFDELIQSGGTVVLHSLPHNSFVHVPDVACPQDADMESDISASLVRGATEGTSLQIVPTSGRHIALKTPDGRFLCVRPRGSKIGSVIQPSPFQVLALHCNEPGDDAEFLPVHSAFHGQKTVSCPASEDEGMIHYLEEDNISFWNPLHQVFLRINESGEVDCSPPWASIAATQTGAKAVPTGWDWERFSMMPFSPQAAPPQGLRNRANSAQLPFDGVCNEVVGKQLS